MSGAARVVGKKNKNKNKNKNKTKTVPFIWFG